jgi:hypothetical protein
MYSPNLAPENLFVELDDDNIKGREEEGKQIISMDEFSIVLDDAANAVDKANQRFVTRSKKGEY